MIRIRNQIDAFRNGQLLSMINDDPSQKTAIAANGCFASGSGVIGNGVVLAINHASTSHLWLIASGAVLVASGFGLQKGKTALLPVAILALIVALTCSVVADSHDGLDGFLQKAAGVISFGGLVATAMAAQSLLNHRKATKSPLRPFPTDFQDALDPEERRKLPKDAQLV